MTRRCPAMRRHRVPLFRTAAVLTAACLPGTAAAAYDLPLEAYRPLNEGRGTSRSEPIDYNTPNGNANLGAYIGTCDLTLTGDLDEVSSWSKALPVAEIWKKASIFFQPH
jgi:hypothetical protein